MGTRADFYVGRGKDMEWIGSIAMDGYPDGQPASPKYGVVIQAKTEPEFRDRVAKMISECGHGTTVDRGWPWPWDDSQTTDYAYAFDGGQVFAAGFGYEWFDPNKPEEEQATTAAKSINFPNMKERKNIAFGNRSGMLMVAVTEKGVEIL